jgi:hypothetical protein
MAKLSFVSYLSVFLKLCYSIRALNGITIILYLYSQGLSFEPQVLLSAIVEFEVHTAVTMKSSVFYSINGRRYSDFEGSSNS